jgi:hypothetical protein
MRQSVLAAVPRDHPFVAIDHGARVPAGVDVSLKKQLIRVALACISPGNEMLPELPF